MAGFQFSETMAGTAVWDTDPARRFPFRFEITASADSLREHLATGEAAISGVVYAPPLADAAPAEGTMLIRPLAPPLGRGIIRYALSFTGDDGIEYDLTGEKRIRWLHLVDSWTTLPAEIRNRAGVRVGRADTRFDLRHEGLRFLRSFRPR